MPSYISKENFSSTLINMLRDQGTRNPRLGKNQFLVSKNNALHFDPNTNRLLNGMHEDSDDDMEIFIQKLEFWFEEMNDRINGWFKRKLQFIIFWLGFLAAVLLNVDTFEITSKLSKDDNLREQFTQLAILAVQDSSNASDVVKKLNAQLNEEELFKIFSGIFR